MAQYDIIDRATGNGKKVELVRISTQMWRRNGNGTKIVTEYQVAVSYADCAALDFTKEFNTKAQAAKSFKMWATLTAAN